MRIISGLHRGRNIFAPSSLPVRPTTDFAKEGLFNVLTNTIDFEAISLLDLFAGTGNISYEFASRGCTNITCVDIDGGCTRFIKKTTETLAMPGIKVINADVFKFLKHKTLGYDIIFADPPFTLSNAQDIPKLVFENNYLKPGGLLILEHPHKTDFSTHPNFWQHRHYGKVNFSFYKG